MKSYADLKQSKKLSEFLSLDTADQCFLNDGTAIKAEINAYNVAIQLWKNSYVEIIPCWSLAALLGIMPKEVKIKGQIYAPCLFPIIDGHWLYKLWYNSNEIIESPIAIWCDNPVDACYEMILKLHELNLL